MDASMEEKINHVLSHGYKILHIGQRQLNQVAVIFGKTRSQSWANKKHC